jgi:hypothetical protein
MTPYKRFINPTYVKVFNYFLKNVVEKQFERKYHQEIKLKLYGIKIKPNSKAYNSIPAEELLNSQAMVIFFIDSENPKLHSSNFVEDLIYKGGKTFLMLQDSSWFHEPNKFLLRIMFNKRPLYDLDYQSDEPLNENSESNKTQYDYEDSEEYYEKIDKLLNKFLSTTGKEKNIPNFLGYRVITGKNRYGEFTVKLVGIFKEPFRSEDSDTIHTKSRKMTKLIKQMFPFLSKATFYGGSTSTLDNYERYLNLEKLYLNRKVKDDDKDDELPFLQEEKNGIKTRLFKESTDNHELKWHFDELDRDVKVVKSNGWLLQMDNEIPVDLTEGKTFFIPKGVYHRVIKGQGDLVVEIKEMKENIILERKKHKYSGEIGNIVKDIIKVFKDNVDGEFYLPEDINEDKMVYEFPKLKTSFSVELKIETNENIETFRTNAAIWHDDETISIVIQYNPKNKKTILYDLIGDLNQNIAHEIRHIYQRHFGTFDLDKPEEEEPYKYYTQPEEIDAQVFGFKRLSNLSKKPYESIVRQWFDKNKDIHQLSDKEAEMVIDKLLEYK